MARSLRIEFPGAFYHVMARGNRRERIFRDDDDHRFFLKALGEACGMTGWRIHAWVLMGNHYHLFLETPEANLTAGMGWLQNAYTRRFNVRHGLWGRLFGDRYKAIPVEGADGWHYRTLADYIHLNPVRARIILPRRGRSVLDYPWSSLSGGIARAPGKRPQWLAAAACLERFELPDSVAGRRRLVERLDRRAMEETLSECGVPPLPEEVDRRCSHLRRGWYWGGEGFAEKLMEMAGRSERADPAKRSPERKAHDAAQAERWCREGLAAAGLTEGELEALKGSDPRKAALAGLLWRQTTVSQGWIARRLRMGSAGNVSQQVRRFESSKVEAGLPEELRTLLAKIRKENGKR